MRCSACGKEIVFVRTAKGKSMPCDMLMVPYWESKSGGYRVITPNGVLHRCELTGDMASATGVGYMPHWASCSRPEHFRRRQEP